MEGSGRAPRIQGEAPRLKQVIGDIGIKFLALQRS